MRGSLCGEFHPLHENRHASARPSRESKSRLPTSHRQTDRRAAIHAELTDRPQSELSQSRRWSKLYRVLALCESGSRVRASGGLPHGSWQQGWRPVNRVGDSPAPGSRHQGVASRRHEADRPRQADNTLRHPPACQVSQLACGVSTAQLAGLSLPVTEGRRKACPPRETHGPTRSRRWGTGEGGHVAQVCAHAHAVTHDCRSA